MSEDTMNFVEALGEDESGKPTGSNAFVEDVKDEKPQLREILVDRQNIEAVKQCVSAIVKDIVGPTLDIFLDKKQVTKICESIEENIESSVKAKPEEEKKKNKKKSESEISSSESESESEDEKPKKKDKKKTKKKAKKESSDEESDSSEDEKPKKKSAAGKVGGAKNGPILYEHSKLCLYKAPGSNKTHGQLDPSAKTFENNVCAICFQRKAVKNILIDTKERRKLSGLNEKKYEKLLAQAIKKSEPLDAYTKRMAKGGKKTKKKKEESSSESESENSDSDEESDDEKETKKNKKKKEAPKKVKVALQEIDGKKGMLYNPKTKIVVEKVDDKFVVSGSLNSDKEVDKYKDNEENYQFAIENGWVFSKKVAKEMTKKNSDRKIPTVADQTTKESSKDDEKDDTDKKKKKEENNSDSESESEDEKPKKKEKKKPKKKEESSSDAESD